MNSHQEWSKLNKKEQDLAAHRYAVGEKVIGVKCIFETKINELVMLITIKHD